MEKKIMIWGIVITVVAVGQIALCILLYDSTVSSTLINLGWLVLWVSAIFGWLPIFTFRKKGEVRGRSYIQTTKLVDSGVYAIVRHPQYLAGALLSVALAMITPHWSVIALGVVAIPIYYFTTSDEESQNIKKFGDAYLDYMQRVPRMNFILGIIRLLQRGKTT
jgi:protein-S-isoprenylcysteine O-methyltransferase Ste14